MQMTKIPSCSLHQRKNFDRIHHVVMEERRLTINLIASDRLSRKRVENIPRNVLGMTKVSETY